MSLVLKWKAFKVLSIIFTAFNRDASMLLACVSVDIYQPVGLNKKKKNFKLQIKFLNISVIRVYDSKLKFILFPFRALINIIRT